MDVIEEKTDRIEVEEFLDLDASYVRTRKMPWYDSTGDVQGIVGHTQDITDRKLREHAFRRQNERMVKVALVASHELRNELQIAYGQLEELADCDGPTADIEESLSQISAIIDTVVELSTNDLNDPVQHDEIEQAPRREHVWLSRLSREVWETLAGSEACLTFDGDTRIVADQESAGLLLQILFQNALEHAGPSVTVTVSTTTDGFFVADDGPGIDVEPLERVFDAGHTAVAGNTGFGLYVARRVAADQGWTVTAAESESGGARFDIGNVDCHK